MFQKKSLGFVLLSLMLISVFSAVFVSAQSIFDPVIDFAKSIGSDWNQGNGYSFGVAKFFIFIIVWILIFGVLDKFPGFKDKNALRFFLSLAVTFLATAYISASELAVVVSSYSALGFVLGGIVPLLIMVFFTASVVSNIRSASGKIWVIRGLWAVFGIYFVYKVLSVGGASASAFVEWGHWILVGLSLVVVFATPFFVKWAMKDQMRSLTQLVQEDAATRAALRDEKAKNVEAIRNRIQRAKGLNRV
ncbi:MAG: hypothetical protein AABY16_02100 [Nanoarchaeota archaeon]